MPQPSPGVAARAHLLKHPLPASPRPQRPPPEGEGALWGDGPDGGGGGAHHGALASDGTPLAEPEYKLAVHNLAYSTPDGRRQLARDLSFVVEEVRRWLMIDD